MMKEDYIPEFVSIPVMCSLMGISRSRYYQLLTGSFILPPVYSLENKRAYFTREMAERNIAVVRNNCGLNGKICLFYNTSRRTGSSPVKPAKNREQKPKPTPDNKNFYQDLIEGLTQLGLQDVKPSQVESVIGKLYPEGVQNQDEGEVLKAVYRAIVAQNSQDNVNR